MIYLSNPSAYVLTHNEQSPKQITTAKNSKPETHNAQLNITPCPEVLTNTALIIGNKKQTNLLVGPPGFEPGISRS